MNGLYAAIGCVAVACCMCTPWFASLLHLAVRGGDRFDVPPRLTLVPRPEDFHGR